MVRIGSAKGWREFRDEAEAYDWYETNGGFLLRRGGDFAWTDSESVRAYLISGGWTSYES